MLSYRSKKTNNPNPSPIGKRFGLYGFGARGGSRTRTPLRALAPEASESTNSTTRACGTRSAQERYYHISPQMSTLFANFFNSFFAARSLTRLKQLCYTVKAARSRSEARRPASSTRTYIADVRPSVPDAKNTFCGKSQAFWPVCGFLPSV